MNAVAWIIIVVVVAGIAGAIFGWDRYRGQSKVSDGAATKTDEVFFDTTTGKQMRVWFNPATGKREYRAE